MKNHEKSSKRPQQYPTGAYPTRGGPGAASPREHWRQPSCHGCYTPKCSLLESYSLCINRSIMDRFLIRSWWRIGPKSIQTLSPKRSNLHGIGFKIVAWRIQTPHLSLKLSQPIRGRDFGPYLGAHLGVYWSPNSLQN